MPHTSRRTGLLQAVAVLEVGALGVLWVLTATAPLLPDPRTARRSDRLDAADRRHRRPGNRNDHGGAVVGRPRAPVAQ